jgi:Zn-dependent peptidase ImmA (M78 family)
MNLYEMFNESKQPTLIDALRDFLPIAIAHLELDHIPKIKLVKSLDDTTFGRYVDNEKVIYAVVANRNPVDILRTIAHEMVHYKQGQEHQLTNDSGETGSDIENEANAEGGVIMREFNEQFPQYLQSKSVQLAESAVPDLSAGVPIQNIIDAERRWSNGERIFAFHEQDDEPHEVRTFEELRSYAPDQLMALA